MADIDIQVAHITSSMPPPERLIHWCSTALGQENQEKELTLRIVSEAEIQTLNQTFRNQAKSTNVLSFPSDLPEAVNIPLLGDIVICAEVVKAEASEQNKQTDAHWAHMVVHGTLHLLGYDHIKDEDADTMEALETKILKQLGFDSPYAPSTFNLKEKTREK